MRTLPTGVKQPISLGRGVPGTAMRRGTAAGGGGGRPMTAVSGAGFSSNKSVPGGSEIASSVVLEPKVET